MATPIHHITLSVSDVGASVAWYEALFGPADIVEREGDGWKRTRMTWPALDDLRIAVMSHDTAPEGRFSHLNRGLDHLGFDCTTADQVAAWADKLDTLGFEHGPIEDVPYAWVVTARDPDNIPIEFFCGK
jgi:catechol 2,3-dioxygenase-like lactoylglutathione lyase family enzyme